MPADNHSIEGAAAGRRRNRRPRKASATTTAAAPAPVETGDLVWKIVQRCKGGEVVHWIGRPDSESPASRTAITESAVPDDVLDVVGGRSSTPTATTPTTTTPTKEPAAATSDEDSRDGLTLAIAIVAAIAAGLAAVLALLAWRNGRRVAPGAAAG